MFNITRNNAPESPPDNTNKRTKSIKKKAQLWVNFSLNITKDITKGIDRKVDTTINPLVERDVSTTIPLNAAIKKNKYKTELEILIFIKYQAFH